MQAKVSPENVWAWAAFQSLRGSRGIGMSLGPIPISEVAAYCDLMNITDLIQRRRLLGFVAALDRAEREWHVNT